MADEYLVSLDTLARGGAVERFDDALREAVINILNPNTDATAKREVLLKVTLKPTRDREQVAATVAVASKLAPATSLGTTLYVGEKSGEPVITEFNPRQPSFAELDQTLNRLKPNDGK